MKNGRRKIRICLLGIVLAAVTIGIFYYYFSGDQKPQPSEGTLVQETEVEQYGC